MVLIEGMGFCDFFLLGCLWSYRVELDVERENVIFFLYLILRTYLLYRVRKCYLRVLRELIEIEDFIGK